jgi:Protein of unknown function (DUF2971)
MQVSEHLLSQLTSATPPEVVYHYTSAKSLQGIVESGQIWATDSRYLNDSLEFQYAVDLTTHAIVALRSKLPERDWDALDIFQRYLEDAPRARIYVASFSAATDVLSQWRAYCPTSGGVCVGIATAGLRARDDCLFLQCIYDADSQQTLILELVGHLLNRFRSFSPDAQEDAALLRLGTLGEEFFDGFLILASIFKHPGFAEEQEWRVLLVDSYTLDEAERTENIHFREGRSGLVPFVTYQISTRPDPNIFPEILVGPNPHISLACDAVKLLLKVSEFKSTIVASKIPYRPW